MTISRFPPDFFCFVLGHFTENAEQTKLQNIKHLIPFIPKEDGEKDRIMTLLGNGEKKAEQELDV
jgi:hypothetical protein